MPTIRYSIIIFKQKPIDEAFYWHEKINTFLVKEKNEAGNEKKLAVTGSIGVAERENNQESAQAIKAADKTLYRINKSGRNQVSTKKNKKRSRAKRKEDRSSPKLN